MGMVPGANFKSLLHFTFRLRNIVKPSIMKFKGYFILALCCLLWLSCKNADSGQCLISPQALHLLLLKVRIVDKTTGADLFLSPTSRYKLSDLSIASSSGTANFFVDSTQKDNRDLMLMVNNSSTFVLKLASLSADTIGASVLVTSGRCYSSTALGEVTLDNSLICNPCSTDPTAVTIKK
jgi:hypothetical protein